MNVKVEMICQDCGTSYFLSTRRSAYIEKTNLARRCTDCHKTYRKNHWYNNLSEQKRKELSERRSIVSKKVWEDLGSRKKEIHLKAANTRKNRPISHKELSKQKIQQTWSSKTDEEMQACRDRTSANIKAFWNNMTEDEYCEFCKGMSDRMKRRISSMSPEQFDHHMAVIRESSIKYWSDMSDIDRLNKSKQVSAASKLYWSELSSDRREAIVKKMSESMKSYWESLSDEDHTARSNIIKKDWAIMTHDQKESKLKGFRNGHRLWFDNLSDEDKVRINLSRSIMSKNHWDKMTKEDFYEWRSKQSEGLKMYFESLDSRINKSEQILIESIRLIGLAHTSHVSNRIKHPEFDNAFPFNPVTGSAFISYSHSWDLRIHDDRCNIWIDIDGSIHREDHKGFLVSHSSGTVYNMIEYIRFNDSQRPYQTDGLPAYIIRCHDDNLTTDTVVRSVTSGLEISFGEFLRVLNLLIIEKWKKRINLIEDLPESSYRIYLEIVNASTTIEPLGVSNKSDIQYS